MIRRKDGLNQAEGLSSSEQTGEKTNQQGEGSGAGADTSFADVPLYGDATDGAVIEQVDGSSLSRCEIRRGMQANLLSNDGRIVASLHLESAVVCPEINRACDARHTALVHLATS